VADADERRDLMSDQSAVASSGTFSIGGDLTVHRLGFGAMQLPGHGVWGPPRDHDAAIAVLRRAVDLGVDLIDTADSYGPDISEELIHEALHPYPEGLVIATKGGLVRTGPSEWWPMGRPEYLRQQVEMSLRKLELDTIDLYQLHRIDPKVPFEESLGALHDLQHQGKIRHIGLSEVTVDEIRVAQRTVEVVTVQNRYNIVDRAYEAVLDFTTEQGIGFIPWFPLATGSLAQDDGPLAKIAADRGVAPSQVALAWLLARAPVMLPIPGTSSVAHLEENVAAADIQLSDAEVQALGDAVSS
jgi:aryl-alcohol dehydrogenase-like predicted oxidoreductase